MGGPRAFHLTAAAVGSSQLPHVLAATNLMPHVLREHFPGLLDVQTGRLRRFAPHNTRAVLPGVTCLGLQLEWAACLFLGGAQPLAWGSASTWPAEHGACLMGFPVVMC